MVVKILELQATGLLKIRNVSQFYYYDLVKGVEKLSILMHLMLILGGLKDW